MVFPHLATHKNQISVAWFLHFSVGNYRYMLITTENNEWLLPIDEEAVPTYMYFFTPVMPATIAVSFVWPFNSVPRAGGPKRPLVPGFP